MFLKIARSIARPQMVAILDLVKRSSGLSVNELAKQLKLSYMGAKQYCNELEKKGMLDTFRRPKEVGRPDMLLRLTDKAAAFYPDAGNELSLDLLESARQLYGPSAPDKLLFNFFSKKADVYLKKIKGATPCERLASLAKIRDGEGYCSQVEIDLDNRARLVEFHSLFKDLTIAFPNVGRLEELMLTKVLGIPVRRAEQRVSGLQKITFEMDVAESATLEIQTQTIEHEEPQHPLKTHSTISPTLVTSECAAEEIPVNPAPETLEIVAQPAQTIDQQEGEESISVYNMLAPPMPSVLPEPLAPPTAENMLADPISKVITPSPDQLALITPAPPPPAEMMELFEEFRLVG